MTEDITIEEAKILSMIRTTTSCISIVASVTIFVMLIRSHKKLTTTQNRLLAGLSVSDVLSSCAMAFGTIPMPQGTTNAWNPLGDTSTCDTQGFLNVFGSCLTPSYNAGLCIYYFLKIRCAMPEEQIVKKAEPFLHIIPITFTSVGCTYSLINEYLNPAASACFISDHPRYCSRDADVQCIRGEGIHQDIFMWCFFVFFALVPPVVIISCMISIYNKVESQERRMSVFGAGSLPEIQSSSRLSRRGQEHVTRTRHRSLAYSTAWFVPHIFPYIQACMSWSGAAPSYTLKVLVAIFFPLQGFFNFGVFIYPRFVEVRRVHEDFSFIQALLTALKRNDEQIQVRRRCSLTNAVIPRNNVSRWNITTTISANDEGTQRV